MSRIAFITSEKLPALVPDDRLALDLLRARGHEAQPAVWTNPALRWADFDLLVLRSCWDYHTRPQEFAAWLDALHTAGVQSRKHGRRSRAGTWRRPTSATWNAPASRRRRRTGSRPARINRWRRSARRPGGPTSCIKPAISATAWQLHRLPAEVTTIPDEARRALDERLFLAQPFVPEIADGEWSLIYFDGVFSHAVVKRPQPGDFRVQDEFGGRATAEPAPPDLVATGSRVLAALPARPLYARVDGVVTRHGFLLLELELLEPALFLSSRAGAHASFADAIEGRL